MYISGTVLASNGFPLSQQLWAWAWNNTRQLSYGANVNFDGSFKIGFTASDTGNWDVGVGSDVWGKTYMEPASQRRTLTAAGDSLIVNFRVYSINATIWGRVYANGDGRVAHQPVFAQNDTTGRSPDTTDVNGYFRIGVSTVAKKYQVHLDWQVYDQLTQAGYYLTSVYPADAAPGDTVLIEFTQGGSIAGRVVDTLEVPIPGVRVFAQMVNGWQSKEAFTDSAGFYMISGLTEGAYRVQAIKEGFYGEYWNDRANDWQADMVFVNSAQTAEGINFSLSPKISASVPGQNFSQTPAAFALVQNYPNPLSLRSGNLTTIQFQVPQSAQVVIAVYNMLGQEVIRLVDQDFKPGYHEVNWTGVNNQGKYLTCGLYLVRMTALNFSENRKLMIVR